MLCSIQNNTGHKVFARNVTKVDGPFRCPGCHGELIIRKGRIKVHHFAHKPPFHCNRGTGETEAHRKCKEAIYQALSSQTNITNLDIEMDCGSAIADVYFKLGNIPVAIEVQRSNLSVSEITQRTKEYERLGIYVLWLALFNEKLNDDKYSPKAWEKWCHAAYFGRVYYWIEGLTIVPVHFNPYMLYVEHSSWYNEYGEEESGGGYEKTSKRYKTPLFGKFLSLPRDFQPSLKRAWQGGNVHVPQCRIYSDRLRKWW